MLRNGKILKNNEKLDNKTKDNLYETKKVAKKGLSKQEWINAFKQQEDDSEVEANEPMPIEECCLGQNIFTDKSKPHTKQDHSTNYKHVFQIWAK